MRRLTQVFENYLFDWGKWRKSPVSGLGYLTDTQSRLMTPMGAACHGITPKYWTNDNARAVENVRSLWVGTGKVRLCLVLWCRYVGDMDHQRGSRAMGCNIDDYETLLVQAHEAMADALEVRCYDTRRHVRGTGITGVKVGRPRKLDTAN